jgi:small-conductance mechanosensitive channel
MPNTDSPWATLLAKIDIARIDIAALMQKGAFIAIVIPLLYLLGRAARRYGTKHYSAQAGAIAQKIIFYLGVFVVFSTVFDNKTVLAVAGIAGIAISLASQTSLSNVIGGIFLLSEKPFVIGDIIAIGDTRATIIEIGLVSVYLRTFDNQMIRIPNETMVKSQITNITRYPIRRMDMSLEVTYKEDLGHVRRVLLELAEQNPLALDEPEPFVLIRDFMASGIVVNFGVWFVAKDYIDLKNNIMQDIKRRFEAEGIEFAAPPRALNLLPPTEPIPIRITANTQKPEAENN